MKVLLKFGFMLAALLTLLFIACSDDSGGGDDERAIVCYGNSLTVGFGAGNTDSPIDINKSYPAYLAKKVDFPIVNLGESGISAKDAVDAIKKHGNKLSSAAFVIIELGANDFLDEVIYYQISKFISGGSGSIDSNFVEEIVEKSLEEILDYINGLGGKRQIFLAKFYNEAVAGDLLKKEDLKLDDFPFLPEGIPSYLTSMSISYDFSFAYERYEDMFARLEEKYGIVIIDNIWDSIWGNSDLMFDMLHPNAAGYEKMANNYFNAINSYLVKE